MTVREFAYATREEYERELRAGGSFTEEEIQRNLAAMPDQQMRLQRWFAREDHYDNFEAFEDHIARIIADNVVTSTEQTFICEVSLQWIDQLQAARRYALDYERDDPRDARQNGIDSFGDKVEKALELTKSLREQCPRLSRSVSRLSL